MDADIIVPCNCSALRQAARHVTRLYDGELAPLGLGLNQYSACRGSTNSASAPFRNSRKTSSWTARRSAICCGHY